MIDEMARQTVAILSMLFGLLVFVIIIMWAFSRPEETKDDTT